MTYLSRHLWFADGSETHVLHEDDLRHRSEPLVILGEAGMGKSTLLSHLAKCMGGAFCTARQLSNRANPQTLIGSNKLLVIDALDEVPAGREGEAVDRVLSRLGQLNFPRFILSCRVADWQASTAAQAITDDYEERPIELHLAGFDPAEQKQLLAARVGSERAQALLDHFESFGLDFLGNPQTLDLVAKLPEGSFPDSAAALFEQVVDVLRREHRDDKGIGEADETSILAGAGAACAALILTGGSVIVSKATANVLEGEVAQSTLASLEPHIPSALGTRLFKPEHGGLTHTHRRVGEFLGARWLALRAHTKGRKKRLLAAMTSNGVVPASLRGLHAWLARDPTLALQVIAADPMGVIEYGDADSISPLEARALFAALEQSSRDNPRFADWRHYRARALVAAPMVAEVRRVIIDKSAEFGIRRLILYLLAKEKAGESLRFVLRRRLLDRAEIFAIRSLAADALDALGGENWPRLVELLRCQSTPDSIRLAYELIEQVGVETFNDNQVVETVLAYDELSLVPINTKGRDPTAARFWRLAEKVPKNRLDELMDVFADYCMALLPEHPSYEENDLADLAFELIWRRLQLGVIEPLRLWKWLVPFRNLRAYHRERGKKVEGWLDANDHARRAIQRYVLLDAPGTADFHKRAFDLTHGSGVSISSADVVALLSSLDPNDRQDERWRDIMQLTRVWGDEGSAVRDAARTFAAHRPDLLSWIDGMAEPSVPSWQRREEERQRSEKAKRATLHAEHRQDYLSKIDRVRAGDYGAILGPAQAYLKRYHDIGDGIPAHERVAEWLGEDLAAAVHRGFQAFLFIKPPHPSAKQIARSFADGKGWAASDIIVAALAERARTRKRPFAAVNSERLAAGLMACWHGAISDHAGIKKLIPRLETELKRRGKWEEVWRLYIQPGLRRRRQHIDGLWRLMTEESEAGLGTCLAEDWLGRFPEMAGEPETYMIDRLLQSRAHETLRRLVPLRLAAGLSDERRRNWIAVGLIVDFKNVLSRLDGAVRRDLLWNLRSRLGDQRRDGRATVSLPPDVLAWQIATFRVLWPSVSRPNGVTSGETHEWDAAEYIGALISRLAAGTTPECMAALSDLRSAPEDGYTWRLRVAAAEQKQRAADELYNPPTITTLRAIIDAGPPTSVKDLRAVVLDALDELQARIRGSSEDIVDWFWTDAGQPRTENKCRDLLLALLGPVLPEGVRHMSEVDMPHDKRADIVFVRDGLMLPVEAKRQMHKELWTAIDAQLDALYTGHWQAEGAGIYLVFWFGKGQHLVGPGPGMVRPTTAAALEAALRSRGRASQSGRVEVVVLDVSR